MGTVPRKLGSLAPGLTRGIEILTIRGLRMYLLPQVFLLFFNYINKQEIIN
jgi:hypothetical protein